MNDALEMILGRLKGVRKTGENQYEAFAPCHDDKRRSLSIGVGEDDLVLLHCQAGCGTDATCHSMALTVADLYPRTNGHSQNGKRPATNGSASKPKTPAKPERTYATADEAIAALPIYAKLGAPDHKFEYGDNGVSFVIARWNATETAKREIRQVSLAEDGRWRCKAPDSRRPLYHLPELLRSDPDEVVFVPEGETCCEALASIDLLAVTSSGGAAAVDRTDWTPLAGHVVAAMPDHDKPNTQGKIPCDEYVAAVTSKLLALNPPAKVRILPLYGEETPRDGQDAVDWIEGHGDAATPETLRDNLHELLSTAKVIEADDPNHNRFAALNAAQFDDAEYSIEYLIDGIFVDGQSGVITAVSKGMKTGTMLDASLSVALGLPFLNHFHVRERRRALVISGESGPGVIQETARRICDSKGVSLRDAGDYWYFSEYIMSIVALDDLDALRELCIRLAIQVLFADPLYLMLPGDDQGNMFAVGEKLRRFAMMCSELGVTAIFCHHATKNVQEGPPLKLSDMAHAGYAQFFRQFALLNRRTPYRFYGVHELWASFSGSAGHASCWGVDIVEGVREPGKQRIWQPTILTVDEVNQRRGDGAERRKEDERQEKIAADARLIIQAMLRHPEGETPRQIRDELGWSNQRFAPALALLRDDESIEDVEVTKRKRTFDGIRLAPSEDF